LRDRPAPAPGATISEPFLGEIRTFAFGVTPRGWAPCRGQLLPINQNQALFSLLGTTYGGDGRVTFALPDLQGRVALGAGTAETGTSFELGARGGEEAHRLATAELPAHRHRARAGATAGTADSPANAVWAAGGRRYAPSGQTGMKPEAIGPAGKNEPHNTMQPYLPLNVCIALFGIFPSIE
jgi:microcystin-dependent protein